MEYLRSAAEEAGQGHIFDCWDALSSDERDALKDDLSDVDFQYLSKTFNASTSESQGEGLAPIMSALLASQPMYLMMAMQQKSSLHYLCYTMHIDLFIV